MIHYKTSEEIELLRQSAQLVSKTLGMISAEIRPGVRPLDLDRLAESFIRDHGGIPAFLGQYGFPNSLCTSVNQHVVHGIPDSRPLEEGDIISVDCGVIMNEFYGDQAYTFAVGPISDEIFNLLKTTYESLLLGVAACKVGNRIGDIGHAIQSHCEARGYGVVRDLVGHGLGRSIHEEPQVPNYGRPGKGKKIQEGLVVAIEPMINMGTYRVQHLKDGWNIVSADGTPSAHFEHDVAVVNGAPALLSTFDYIFEVTGNPFEKSAI